MRVMAREVEKIFGIEVHGSLYLIFLMIKKGGLEREEAKDKVNVMIKNGFRLGHEGYLKCLELLKTI
jgi:predicted nucleic acid-binding protein